MTSPALQKGREKVKKVEGPTGENWEWSKPNGLLCIRLSPSEANQNYYLYCFVYISISFFSYLSIFLSTNQSINQSVYSLSVCLSACLLSVCMSIKHNQCVYLYIYLSSSYLSVTIFLQHIIGPIGVLIFLETNVTSGTQIQIFHKNASRHGLISVCKHYMKATA